MLLCHGGRVVVLCLNAVGELPITIKTQQQRTHANPPIRTHARIHTDTGTDAHIQE